MPENLAWGMAIALDVDKTRRFGFSFTKRSTNGPSCSRGRPEPPGQSIESTGRPPFVNLNQNVNRTPNWMAKEIPTVVPGPKKSPNAPPATRN